MEPIIKTGVATTSAFCAALSILYSPALLWAVVTLDDDWRMQLHGPQIARVPFDVRMVVAAAFLMLAIVMCTDVGVAYPDSRFTIRLWCVIGVVAGVVVWFLGPWL